MVIRVVVCMEKNKKQALILSIVGVLTLITLVAGATFAYFKAQGGEGGSSDVNVITATTDLLTFKIDKAINISISQSEFKKGNPDASDSTGAHATLTASNSKNVEKTTRSYNIYFVIDTNDFEYTTQDGTPELYLNVTDPNGNKLENITGLVHYDKGFDITTRTGGFLLVPDYDIEATRGNTITQDWKVEVTFANLDTDQSKNMGKSLSGKLFVTSDKMNSYELSKITNMTTKTTYNSIDTTLEVEQGTAEVNKYFYGIEKTSSNVTGYVNNSGVKKVALKDVTFVETDKNTYKFDNLSDNSVYKVYSYGIDKNGIKTNLYETEVTTSEYNYPVVNSVSHTSTLNSITLSVNATKGDNDIVKYYYSKDNGQTYEESDTNSYVFNNLKDTTEYKIKVKVLDSYGRYSTEFVKAVSTETYILPSVTSVTPTTKYNQISVSVVGANGTNNISKYYYSINDGAYTERTNSSYTFTGLNEKTNYSIKVKAVDTLGRESNVYNLSVTTDAYVLPRVTNVSTSSTSNSITINVSASGGTGNVVKYYYSKDNGSNYVESTSSSYTFSNLTSNATFYVKVYVKDSNNRESSVSATSIKTMIPTIKDVCSSGTNLASCIKTFGDKGSEISSIYIHNSSLTNGAGDGSYRYAGGDYVLTEAGKATGATMMIGYNNTVTTALIDFYCNATKQYVGYGCGASQTHYYLIKGETTQYQTYKETLNKAVEKGYLTKGNVKNFVCFGSTASPCPTENLYRIIGVFGNNVKLIKWDYAKSSLLGTDGDFSQEYSYYFSGEQGENPSSNSLYYWNNSTQKNTWSESNLNKVNLNTNFINNIGTEWANKIADTAWKVGGNTWANIGTSPMNTAYQNEIVNPVTTNTIDNKTEYTAKIGLMYVSDYGYAADPSSWTLAGYNSDYTKSYASARGENWLYGGGWDWTISRYADHSGAAFMVHGDGGVYGRHVGSFNHGCRPSFNLESSITYVSGSGTAADPITIN